jgi:hypothetical protein
MKSQLNAPSLDSSIAQKVGIKGFFKDIRELLYIFLALS